MDFTKLKKNFTRIFSNPNTLTFILAIISIIILYRVYAYMVNNAIQPTTLYFAATDLYEGDQVTNDKISPVEISGSFLNSQNGTLLRGRGQIINKYVANGFRIPQNSFFYKSALTDLDSADETPFTNLPDNWTIYRLPVDFSSTYGCSIMTGDYIDIYATFDYNGKLFNDIFIKSIQVYMVVDKSGYDVFTHTRAGEGLNPATLYFAVPIEQYRLLEIANRGKQYSIKFYPVPRETSYSENPEQPSIANQQLVDLILSQALDEQ